MTAATRGSGLLEKFLARQRAKLADSLIDDRLRTGRILDIGCGSSPLFLRQTRFAERYGIDPMIRDGSDQGIRLYRLAAGVGQRLPFDDGFFSVVTLLAVIEHLAPDQALPLLAEVHRLLAPGGQLIVTTPVAWSDRLLRTMARIRLVSPEEINEHQAAYDRRSLTRVMAASRFREIETGHFELGFNLWARAAARPEGPS